MMAAALDAVEVRGKLRQFILNDLVRQPEYALRDDEPLITSGLMDSLALAHIAVFIETEFAVYIPDPQLTVERMNTVDLMVARVLRGSGSASS